MMLLRCIRDSIDVGVMGMVMDTLDTSTLQIPMGELVPCTYPLAHMSLPLSGVPSLPSPSLVSPPSYMPCMQPLLTTCCVWIQHSLHSGQSPCTMTR